MKTKILTCGFVGRTIFCKTATVKMIPSSLVLLPTDILEPSLRTRRSTLLLSNSLRPLESVEERAEGLALLQCLKERRNAAFTSGCKGHGARSSVLCCAYVPDALIPKQYPGKKTHPFTQRTRTARTVSPKERRKDFYHSRYLLVPFRMRKDLMFWKCLQKLHCCFWKAAVIGYRT